MNANQKMEVVQIFILNRRAVSAGLALIVSAIALIAEASKTKEDIENLESRKKNRTYRVKETKP